MEKERCQQQKKRQEEKAEAQQREREWRKFQRNYGVDIPKTPPPCTIDLAEGTPVSALSETRGEQIRGQESNSDNVEGDGWRSDFV